MNEWQNGHPTKSGVYLLDYGTDFCARYRFKVAVLENDKLYEIGESHQLSKTTYQYLEIPAPEEA
jgi:hypothetical protein